MWQYYPNVLHHLNQRLCVRVKLSAQLCDETQIDTSEDESDGNAEEIDLTGERDTDDAWSDCKVQYAPLPS